MIRSVRKFTIIMKGCINIEVRNEIKKILDNA